MCRRVRTQLTDPCCGGLRGGDRYKKNHPTGMQRGGCAMPGTVVLQMARDLRQPRQLLTGQPCPALPSPAHALLRPSMSLRMRPLVLRNCRFVLASRSGPRPKSATPYCWAGLLQPVLRPPTPLHPALQPCLAAPCCRPALPPFAALSHAVAPSCCRPGLQPCTACPIPLPPTLAKNSVPQCPLTKLHPFHRPLRPS